MPKCLKCQKDRNSLLKCPVCGVDTVCYVCTGDTLPLLTYFEKTVCDCCKAKEYKCDGCGVVMPINHSHIWSEGSWKKKLCFKCFKSSSNCLI